MEKTHRKTCFLHTSAFLLPYLQGTSALSLRAVLNSKITSLSKPTSMCLQEEFWLASEWELNCGPLQYTVNTLTC